jgi:hypothetical protein
VHALLVGEVLGPDSTPVGGAFLDVFIRREVCDSSQSPFFHNTFSTESDGTFDRRLFVPNSDPFDGCLTIEITPPIDSRLSAGLVDGVKVAFRLDTQEADVAEVQIMLDQSAGVASPSVLW